MKQIDDTNSPSRVRSRTAVASLGLWHARSTSRQVSRRRRSRGRVRMGLSGKWYFLLKNNFYWISLKLFPLDSQVLPSWLRWQREFKQWLLIWSLVLMPWWHLPNRHHYPYFIDSMASINRFHRSFSSAGHLKWESRQWVWTDLATTKPYRSFVSTADFWGIALPYRHLGLNNWNMDGILGWARGEKRIKSTRRNIIASSQLLRPIFLFKIFNCLLE